MNIATPAPADGAYCVARRRVWPVLAWLVCCPAWPAVVTAADRAPPVFIAEPVPQLAPEIVGREGGWHRDEDGNVVIIRQDGSRHVLRDPCALEDQDELEKEIDDARMPWGDRTHQVISRALCQPTQWVDSFFTAPGDTFSDTPGTFLRIVLEQRLRDDGEQDTDAGFSGQIALPGLEDRARVFLRSRRDDRDDRFSSAAQASSEEEDETGFQAGLRAVLRGTDNMEIDADVGIRSRVRPFVQLRYRHRWPLGATWSWRIGETVSWQYPEGLESRSRIEFDRPFGEDSAFRVSSLAVWSEENFEDELGWFLRQRVSVSTRLSDRSAVNTRLQAEAFTRPRTQVDNYLLAMRYRRNVGRPWLYIELEPFVLWPRESDFDTLSGIWLRLETRWGLADD